ncbi:MAG: hypothetical protein HQL46_15830 [Gammaproteobacteria bacterium]|nr:hypothetical protein [Gammaproteobacteria bacterium]
MNKRQTDRRSSSRNIQFPIMDSEGTYIGEDRRCGLDRRKWQTESVGVSIISQIGLSI